MGRALSNWRALPGDRSCAGAERCGKGLAGGLRVPNVMSLVRRLGSNMQGQAARA